MTVEQILDARNGGLSVGERVKRGEVECNVELSGLTDGVEQLLRRRVPADDCAPCTAIIASVAA